MEFSLSDVKLLVDNCMKTRPDIIPYTDDWLDNRYVEDRNHIGHFNKYYRLFYDISKKFKPRLTVELGSYWATAAAHFASGYPDGEVITIDIHKDDQHAHLKAHEAAAQYENLKFLLGWTWDDHVVQYVASMKPIDILYIDAWHEYQYAIKEWELYSPMLADTALVICDDIFDMAGATVDMVKFWDELPGEKFLHTGLHGWVPMGFLRFTR